MKNEFINIDKLSEFEAKRLLRLILVHVKNLEKSNEQLHDELHVLYERFAEQLIAQTTLTDRDYEAVHIAIGESVAGTIRVGMGHHHKVIGFPDYFAAGPLYHLHEVEGQKLRKEWLKDRINILDDFYEVEYEHRFKKTVEEILDIPEDLPINLWIGENVNEQTGLRYIMYLLENKPNTVYLINSTGSYENLVNTGEVQYKLKHTGEMVPEKVKLIYEKKLGRLLTEEQCDVLLSEWIALTKTKEVLRIWENEEIKSVPEDYFDSFIIEITTELHERYGSDEFIKASRLIGEVFGRSDDLIGDGFIEYRLRELIYQGVFEMKGIPKGMRYYRVRLKQN